MKETVMRFILHATIEILHTSDNNIIYNNNRNNIVTANNISHWLLNYFRLNTNDSS